MGLSASSLTALGNTGFFANAGNRKDFLQGLMSLDKDNGKADGSIFKDAKLKNSYENLLNTENTGNDAQKTDAEKAFFEELTRNAKESDKNKVMIEPEKGNNSIKTDMSVLKNLFNNFFKSITSQDVTKVDDSGLKNSLDLMDNGSVDRSFDSTYEELKQNLVDKQSFNNMISNTSKMSEINDTAKLFDSNYNSSSPLTNTGNSSNVAASNDPASKEPIPQGVPMESNSDLSKIQLTEKDQAIVKNLNAKFKDVLAGQGELIVKIAKSEGVDPALFASILAHETGYGTSKAIKNDNNPGGIMDPKSGWSKLKHFNSLEEGLKYTAHNLRKGYIEQGRTSIADIGAKYCPVGAANDPNGLNKNWVPNITATYKEFNTV